MATLIGTSAITGMVALDPRPPEGASHRLSVQMELRGDLLHLLQQRGVVAFESPQTICPFLEASSNSSFGIEASIGPTSCGAPPPNGAVEATLSMRLVPCEVDLVAWSAA